MRSTRRAFAAPRAACLRQAPSATGLLGLAAAVSITCLLLLAAPASASHQQQAMFQDSARVLADPVGTLHRLRLLGVTRIRLFVAWNRLAPHAGSHRRPKGFRASDPKSYPAKSWAPYDQAIVQAKAAHVALDVDLGGGAPLWATGPGAPHDQPHPNWDPSPSEFRAFVHAIGTRYSGTYNPRTHKLAPGNAHDLPAVHFWSVWNEPDYGPSLAPQGAPGHLTIERSPWMYRNLVDAAWRGLRETSHGHDTVLIGEVAPRGYDYWGVFSGMKPLVFIRAMYCVDAGYRPLRGAGAVLRGCPRNSAGTRRFRAAHPALFGAGGFSDHPYSRWYPPNVEAQPDPNYATLAQISNLIRALDRTQRVYGSRRQFPIWNTEYGYLTSPPKHPDRKTPWVSPNTAAYYLNWAEFISWRNPRIQSTMQFLLADPLPALRSNNYGGFASGLLTFRGQRKPGFIAYRLPLFLPVTKVHRGHSLEVWGCVRPAHMAGQQTGRQQVAEIQLQPGSHAPFRTIKTVTLTDPNGYFDTRVFFPRSGAVRVTWAYPAPTRYADPYAVASRYVQIKVQ